MLDRQQSVADLVLDHSECAEVLQRHRIDFCCRGDLTIAAAAKSKGLDPDALLGELAQAIAGRSGDKAADPRDFSTAELVAHIVDTHHQYLRKCLPFVGALAAKVATVHGDHNPKLCVLDMAVAELEETLIPHLDEEEQGLFPALLAKDQDSKELARALASMREDHLTVAELLERIRAASDDFTLPPWACNSYRTLFAELKQLESDVFTHVHLENNLLKSHCVDRVAD